MRDVLSSVLTNGDDDFDQVDRILASAFFRKRPLQAGTSAHVIILADRAAASASTRIQTKTDLLGGGRRR